MGSCVSTSHKVRICHTTSLIKIDDTWELKTRVVRLVMKLATMSNNFEKQFNQCIIKHNKNLGLNYKLKQLLLQEILAKVHNLLICFEEIRKKLFCKKGKILESTKKIESELTEFEKYTLEIQNMSVNEDENINYFDSKSIEIVRIKNEIESNFSKLFE